MKTILKNTGVVRTTTRQNEILTGALLGDGSLYWSKANPEANSKFTFTQSLRDNEGISKYTYLGWMFNELMPASNSVTNNEINYTLVTYTDKIFSELEKKWYLRDENGFHINNNQGNRTKIVPSDLLLTPLTVCIWFMDDGALDAKNGNATFCTHGFTWEECEFLTERLKIDVNIECHVKKDWRNYPVIFVGVKSQKDLINLIKPHVAWDCFKYKLDDSYDKVHQSGENHSQAKLTDMRAREMITLRKAGKSIAQLAEIFKVSKSNVSLITSGERWTHLRESVSVAKKPRVTKNQIEQIVILAKQGRFQKDIANELNVNQSTVSRILKNTPYMGDDLDIDFS